MSLAGFKKQFNKTSQFLSEKVAGNKGSEIEQDFLEMGRKMDVVNENVESIQNKTKEYLQPNPSARTKMAMQATYQKARGHTTNTKYPQPEKVLADVFTKFGGGLNDMSCYADSLLSLGSAFDQLSETKDEMEAEVKQNFLDPMYEMQQKDLKEIAHHRKKLEGRRLDYDYKKNKGDKVTMEELRLAEEKFDESKDLCYSSMSNFLDSELEHISQLHKFAESVRDYHRKCGDTMDQLAATLSEKLAESKEAQRSNGGSTSRLSVTNSSRTSRESIHTQSNQSISAPIPHPGPDSMVPQKPCAKAIYDFEAENEGELAFDEGDVILLSSRIDENWLQGSVNGKFGYFPENYVEIVVPL